MRHAAAMLAVLILLCALPERAYAEELAERAAEEAGAYSLEEQLTDEEKEISGRLSFDGSYDAGDAIARVWKKLPEQYRIGTQGQSQFRSNTYNHCFAVRPSAAHRAAARE